MLLWLCLACLLWILFHRVKTSNGSVTHPVIVPKHIKMDWLSLLLSSFLSLSPSLSLSYFLLQLFYEVFVFGLFSLPLGLEQLLTDL